MAGRQPGWLGGPGLPDRVRLGKGTVHSRAIMEQDNFGRFISDAERAGGQLLEQLGDAMAKKAKENAPVRTGRLRNSIRPVMLSNNREVRIFSDVPYAGVQEYGTRKKEYRIHGVRANFDWIGGHFVWNHPRFGPIGSGKKYENWTEQHGATVVHPGVIGQRYMGRAFDTVWPTARGLMRKVYNRV